MFNQNNSTVLIHSETSIYSYQRHLANLYDFFYLITIVVSAYFAFVLKNRSEKAFKIDKEENGTRNTPILFWITYISINGWFVSKAIFCMS